MIKIPFEVLHAAHQFLAKRYEPRVYLQFYHLSPTGRVEASDGHSCYQSDIVAPSNEASVIFKLDAAPKKCVSVMLDFDAGLAQGLDKSDNVQWTCGLKVLEDFRFPELARIFSKVERDPIPTTEIGICPVLMSRVAKVFPKGCILSFFGAGEPILFTSPASKARVMIMPMRL